MSFCLSCVYQYCCCQCCARHAPLDSAAVWMLADYDLIYLVHAAIHCFFPWVDQENIREIRWMGKSGDGTLYGVFCNQADVPHPFLIFLFPAIENFVRLNY